MATDFGDGNIGLGTINHYFTNQAGNYIFARCSSVNIPSSVSGYATGCVLFTADTGLAYVNQGTATSCSFVQLASGGGGGVSIPFSELDSVTTTGSSFAIQSTALTTGNIYLGTGNTGNFTTGAAIFKADLVAATAGNGFVAVTTGVYTGTGLLTLTANNATTGTLALISGTGLTSGSGLTLNGGGANMTSTGVLLNANLGAAIAGSGIDITTTGTYTDTTGLLSITANSLTTGTLEVHSATAQTSGTLWKITGGGANITTGILVDIEMGAATAGTGLKVLTSGVFAGSNNVVLVSANSATTTTGIVSITGTGLTSGSGLLVTGGGANLATGKVIEVAMGAATAGNGISVISTGVYATGSTGLVVITANSATTTTGLLQVSGTGLTSGSAILATGGGANLTSGGKVVEIAMGAATTGNGLTITSTGAYTAAAGNALLLVTANSATTPQGGLVQVSGTGLTTGVGLKVTAAAATLTTGFYFAANDGALNTFTIGANGHLTSNQTTAPTIAVTTQNGITAAAITAGSTDTCGTITTTGTNNNGGNTVLTITFNKTYTVAPKAVIVTEVNNSAGIASIFVTTTATTFVLNIVASASSGATPSWTYTVIA